MLYVNIDQPVGLNSCLNIKNDASQTPKLKNREFLFHNAVNLMT